MKEAASLPDEKENLNSSSCRNAIVLGVDLTYGRQLYTTQGILVLYYMKILWESAGGRI